MEIKISIIDATPAEIAQVMDNIKQLQGGSTTTVETKTANLDFSARKPKAPAKGKGSVKHEDPEPEEEETEEEEAEEEAEVEEAEDEQEEEETPKTRKRRSKAEIEADKLAEKKGKGKKASDDDDEAPAKKKSSPDFRETAPGLVQKLADAAEELIEAYEPGDGEKALKKILKGFGVSDIASVAPADRIAVLQLIKNDLES